MKKQFVIDDAQTALDHFSKMRLWLESNIKSVGFPDEKAWIPSLCFEEYLTNLLKYGNVCFPTVVTLQIIIKSDQFMLHIEDQGEYFDIKSHLGHYQKEEIGGVGLLIIKSLMKVEQKKSISCNSTVLSLEL
jgi:anti-sigma regulatory factor (Ser/Thr protein kinase)